MVVYISLILKTVDFWPMCFFIFFQMMLLI